MKLLQAYKYYFWNDRRTTILHIVTLLLLIVSVYSLGIDQAKFLLILYGLGSVGVPLIHLYLKRTKNE